MRVLRRRDFGPWGLGLSEADFACALAGAGVFLAASQRWPPFDKAFVQQTLHRLLSTQRALLPWQLPEPLTDLVAFQGADAPLFANAYKTASILGGRHPRFELYLPISIAPWIAAQLCHPSVRAGSVYTLDNDVSGDLHWSWPLKVGFLSDPASQALSQELKEFRDHQTLSTIVNLPTSGVDADVLILPFDLKTALLQVLSNPLPIRTSIVLVLGGFGTWDDSSAALLGALKAHVRASAVAVLHIEPARHRGWFDALITELSHNRPLDVALLQVRDEDEEAPFLTASERFVKTAALPSVIQTLLHDLSLGDRNQTLRVTEHVLSRLGIQRELKSGHESFDEGNRVKTVLGELEGAVQALLANAHFNNESAEATTIATLNRDTQDVLNKNARPVRRIQAQVYSVADLTQPKLVQAIQRDTPYQVDVRIGLSNANWVNLPDPFPDEKLPNDGKVHELTIIFVEPNLAPEPQVTRVLLPETGSTEVVAFYVSTNAQSTQIEARITVLHQNRVLQTALLKAPVSPKEVEAKGSVTLEPEVVVSPDLTNLGGRTPFDVALVCNHTNGEPRITACADDFASLITMEDPVKFVVDLGKQFAAVANRSADQVDPKDRAALFENIAARGTSLFQAILRGAGSVDMKKSAERSAPLADRHRQRG
ncbi:MAG: hypothetical protein IPK82_17460 [Polyangiaceae bacterium]|nr:hypothetical protein [Polyangiaceae bacterium]